MAYSGFYKGTRFRSLLELSVIIHLESEGLILGESMLYEVTKVPYGKIKKRTYIVDLTIPHLKILIEIKPASRAENKNNVIKRRAAELWCDEHGWSYVIVTEQELLRCGELFLLEEAAAIPGVTLGERAVRALRRKKRTIDKKKKIGKL